MHRAAKLFLSSAAIILSTHATAVTYEKQDSDYDFKRVALSNLEIKTKTSMKGTTYTEVYVTYTLLSTGKVGVAACLAGKVCESLIAHPDKLSNYAGKHIELKLDVRYDGINNPVQEDVIMDAKVVK